MTIDEIIEQALREDLGDGDHTSISCIPADAKGKAHLIIKENGILSGIHIAGKVFKKVDPYIHFKPLLEEGANIVKNDIAFIVEGSSISLLSAERLALNFMQRMSGIATATKKITDRIKDLPAKILDTRKTTPLLRILEKQAVVTGGGANHRMGLYDMILIKDNHIDFAGGIKEAIQATQHYLKAKQKSLKIEIEARNLEEVEEILACGGVHRIMLDNFNFKDLKIAIEQIDGKYETEASGGITIENARDYALCGVDFISMGALTHKIKSLDMSLKAIR